MKDLETIIDVAVNWWADKVLCGSVHRDGTDELPNFMAGLTADMLNEPVDDPNIATKFKTLLHDAILAENLEARKEITLRCDYGPSGLLESVANGSGVPCDNFPWKTFMVISLYNDQDSVVVYEGNHPLEKTVILEGRDNCAEVQSNDQ